MQRVLFISSFRKETPMKKVRIGVSVCFFCLAMVATLVGLTGVFRKKELTSMHENFVQYKKGELDTIFIGTSHQFCSIDPTLLYEEYGISSFMMATAAQPVGLSYYAAMEAIELQEPELIVLEANYCANDVMTMADGMSHMFFDGMPNTKAKHLALQDFVEKDKWLYYYFDFFYYHNRWKELSNQDFLSQVNDKRGGFVSEKVGYYWEIPVVDKSEKKPMPEKTKEYLDKLIALCREKEVDLVVYVAPFLGMDQNPETVEAVYEMQKVYNWLGDYLAQENVAYHNLFYELDEIGLDYTTDFYDPMHCNYLGQEKITRYMVDKGYIY